MPEPNEKPVSPHERTATWTRVLATSTVVLSIATIVSAYFLWRTDETLKQTLVEIRNSIAVNREQLRAVVSFTGGTVLITKDKEGKPTYYIFSALFQNHGGTRTEHFKAWDSIHFFENTVPNNLDLAKPWQQLDTSDTIIGPNSPYQLQGVTIDNDTVQKVLRKEGVILLWGKAEWSDIFEPAIVHPIGFCMLVIPNQATTTGEILPQFVPYRNDCNYNK
jgi:hypothetical protein